MADYKNLVAFIVKAEGGLTGNRKDSASKYPSNCGRDKNGNPYHTNKGIQWSTFKSLSTTAGYDASCTNFITMPDEIWGKIYKVGYWDKVQGDRISNQAIANTFAEMTWMSGLGSINGKSGTLPFLKRFFKDTYNSNFTDIGQMVDFVNDLEKKGKNTELFNKLIAFRRDRFISMKQPVFLKGWLSRLNSFANLNTPYVDSIRFQANENYRKMSTEQLLIELDAISRESFNEYVDDDIKIRYFIGKYGDIFVKYVKGTNLYFNAVLTISMYETSFGNNNNVKIANNFGNLKFDGSINSDSWVSNTNLTLAKYPSADEGIKAFITELTTKYKKGIDTATSPEKQITNIVNSGFKKGYNGQSYLAIVQPTLDAVKKLFTFGKIK